MTDPSNALKLFQKSFKKGKIPLQKGEIDPEIFLCTDTPNGKPRFNYLRIDGHIITALVMFALTEPINGTPCFNIGYAVPPKYQGRGIAQAAIKSVISELKNGLAKNKISSFFIEAVIGIENEASKRVAEATISDNPTEITDCVSGLPALRYVHEIS